MSRLTPEELEARLHALLREQPMRRAPHTLEGRVLAEIARREARPWWQKSFGHWPVAMQAAFLLVSLVLVGAIAAAALTWLGGNPVGTSVRVAIQPFLDTVTTLRSAGAALLDVVRSWIPSISPLWIYLGLGIVGVAYATLVGLGATVYRLWLQPR